MRPSLIAPRAFLLAAVAASCTPQFDNSTTLEDLRLIAVTAEPPEILIDLEELMDNPALLAGLPSIEITPLVIDPRGEGRMVEYRVEACGNRPGESGRGPDSGPGRVNDTISQAPCPDGATPVAQGAVVPGEDGSAPITITFTPTPELLVAAARADPLGLELGLPIVLSFTFQAGEEEVVAIKRVLFSPRLSPEQVPNRNPRIAQLWFRSSKEDPPSPMDPAAPPTVAPGAMLHVQPTPAEAESYLTRVFSRDERRFVTEEIPAETLRYAFYATGGVFSPGGISTRLSPLLTDPVIELETTYQAEETPAPENGGQVHLFVVVRDERGGSSFIRARLLIGESVK
jgi:hypothetical protein